MSFDLICSSCGAPSGPSTGVCPFCKAVLDAGAASESDRSLNDLKRLYREGALARALALGATLESSKPKLLENVSFLVLFAKILLESEGPTTKIKGLLGKAYALKSEDSEVTDYLEITEAKSMLVRDKDDAGEQRLKDLLRRSPDNVHALFFLGAHLFWMCDDSGTAIRLLERCVSRHPGFLRAWGCLGAIYEKLGNAPLSAKAFQRCVALESEPGMKAFFKSKVEAVKRTR
jgi:predicted Zn-dependent protease